MRTRSAVGPTRSFLHGERGSADKESQHAACAVEMNAPSVLRRVCGMAQTVWRGPVPGSGAGHGPTKTSTRNAPPNARAGRFPVAAPVLRLLGPLLVVVLERQIMRVAWRPGCRPNGFGGDPAGSRSRCSDTATLSAVITCIDLLPVQVIQRAGSKTLDHRAAFPHGRAVLVAPGCRRSCEASRPQPSVGGASSPHPRGG